MLQANFQPFPTLQTSRLILKQIDDDDTDDVFEIRSDKDTMHFIPRPMAKTQQDALDVINKINDGITRNESINWGIFLKGNPKLVGIIGFVRINKESFRAEIGYVLNKNFHRQGLMTESVRALIDYGFNNLGLNSIEAVIHPDNKASIGVIEMNQFVKEAYLREYAFYNNNFEDMLIFSLLKSGVQKNGFE